MLEGWSHHRLIEHFAKLSLLLATALCVGWGLVLVRVWQTTAAFRPLPGGNLPDDDDEEASIAGPKPSISVVVAARNEAAALEPALRSLLAQESVDLELIVVDDDSSDATLAIAQRIAAEAGAGKMVVIAQKKLPPGWIAKNYALELGQGRARGEWLLFTDADVLHEPRALRNAVGVMQRERLDHLALFPRLEAGSLIEALVLPLFVLLYQLRFVDPRASDPESPHGTGIGAFNMVRAEAYRLRGTHARIRGNMLDDNALGVMMRDEQGRGSVMRAFSQVRLRPWRSLSEVYFGVRKSILAQFGNSAAVAVAAAATLVTAAVAPMMLVVASLPLWWTGHPPWPLAPAAVAALFPMIGLFKARSLLRFEPLAALLFPVGALVIATSALHAALIFGVKGTVEWRGRSYTKKDFKNS